MPLGREVKVMQCECAGAWVMSLAVRLLLNKCGGWVTQHQAYLGHGSEGCRVYRAQHQHSGLGSLLTSYTVEKRKGARVGSDEMGVQSLQTWQSFSHS